MNDGTAFIIIIIIFFNLIYLKIASSYAVGFINV